MKVIMIHDVGGVGRRDEVKNVSDGHALNFLIPQGHAVQATAERLKAHEERVNTLKRAHDDHEKALVQGFERLRGARIRIVSKANATGGLYQEISASAVANAIQREYGIHVPPNIISISNPIKAVGEWPIHITQGSASAELHVSVQKIK